MTSVDEAQFFLEFTPATTPTIKTAMHVKDLSQISDYDDFGIFDIAIKNDQKR